MLKQDLFYKEEKTLELAKNTLKSYADLTKEKHDYERLIKEYEELLSQTRVLSKVGDRLHKKINKTNELVKEKNKRLEETLELLLTEKAGRQAILITFIFFLIIFILTEVFLDPVVEKWAHQTFPNRNSIEVIFGLGIKIIIALLLRPIEFFVEKVLIKKARMKQLKQLLP